MLDAALAVVAPQIPLGIDAGTSAAGDAIAQQIATSEWLGPLAPVALSPFFGLTVLSGIATYGPDWLQERSQLFSDGSMLNSPALFWTMAALSLLTSLPRLSKVSKPLALAAENLEAYSAVIILFAVRMFSAGGSPANEASLAFSNGGFEAQMVSAGFAGFTVDLLMSAVAALNVIVINGVKLFFEFFVWLIPFPTVDAMVETANKLACAALMSLYCFSPTAATAVNIFMLVACAMVFGWTYRRVRFYRHVIVGPVLAWLAPQWFAHRGTTIPGFCDEPTGGLPRYTPVLIERRADTSYLVRGRWWWRTLRLDLSPCQTTTELGVIANQLRLMGPDGRAYVFVHRRWVSGDASFMGYAEASQLA